MNRPEIQPCGVIYITFSWCSAREVLFLRDRRDTESAPPARRLRSHRQPSPPGVHGDDRETVPPPVARSVPPTREAGAIDWPRPFTFLSTALLPLNPALYPRPAAGIPAVLEASPSLVYGARLLSGFRVTPDPGFKSRSLRHVSRDHGVRCSISWTRRPVRSAEAGAWRLRRLPYTCRGVRSPGTTNTTALVAQRIEHLTTDQKVGGSSPSERATLPQVTRPVLVMGTGL